MSGDEQRAAAARPACHGGRAVNTRTSGFGAGVRVFLRSGTMADETHR
jgi:hypothetical protein